MHTRGTIHRSRLRFDGAFDWATSVQRREGRAGDSATNVVGALAAAADDDAADEFEDNDEAVETTMKIAASDVIPRPVRVLVFSSIEPP